METKYLETVLREHSSDMSGKTVIITGTTSGTGYVAAREVANLGADVLLLNRDSERASRSFLELKQQIKAGSLKAISCDLQSFKSVHKACDDIEKNYKCIDVICMNAGVMAIEDYATEDGYDVQMQTNMLSHALLFNRLVPLVRASKEARIVTHSSMARLGNPLELQYFDKNGGNLGGNGSEKESLSFRGPRWERYHQTKLANFVYTYVLKDLLDEKKISNILSITAHPGLAATNLQVTSAKTGGMDLNAPFMSHAQSAEDGALGIIRACIDPTAKSGDFFGPKEWSGFAEKLTPEKDLLTDANKSVLLDGTKLAVGLPEL